MRFGANAKAAAASPAPAATNAIADATKNITFYGVLDGGFERITNIKTSTTEGSVSATKPRLAAAMVVKAAALMSADMVLFLPVGDMVVGDPLCFSCFYYIDVLSANSSEL